MSELSDHLICPVCKDGILRTKPHSDNVDYQWCTKCSYFKWIPRNWCNKCGFWDLL